MRKGPLIDENQKKQAERMVASLPGARSSPKSVSSQEADLLLAVAIHRKEKFGVWLNLLAFVTSVCRPRTLPH